MMLTIRDCVSRLSELLYIVQQLSNICYQVRELISHTQTSRGMDGRDNSHFRIVLGLLRRTNTKLSDLIFTQESHCCCVAEGYNLLHTVCLQFRREAILAGKHC